MVHPFSVGERNNIVDESYNIEEDRPVKDLVRFDKVFIEVGDEGDAQVTLKADRIAFQDESRGKWAVT